jgi:hypothetical protein
MQHEILDEVRATATQSLEVVYGLLSGMAERGLQYFPFVMFRRLGVLRPIRR